MNRKISDLLDDYNEAELDLTTKTPLSAERIRELTMSKIENKNQKPKRIAFRVLAAAALIAALMMSVFAAEKMLTYENWLDDFFSDKTVTAEITENQKALLEQGLEEINQSVTSNGWTVTLEQALTDGYSSFVTCRVTAPEGTVLDGLEYNFDEIPVELFGDSVDDGKYGGTIAGWHMPEDPDKTDNSILLVLRINLSDPAQRAEPATDGAVKTFTVNTLKVWDEEGSWETVAEGEWTFTFSFGDTDAMTAEVEMLPEPVTCTGRRWMVQQIFDVSVQVTSFRLRSLSATLVYEEPLTGYWDGIRLDDIFIVMKDGTRIKADYSMGVNCHGTFESTYKFDVPISIADVDYVEFPGGDTAYMP